MPIVLRTKPAEFREPTLGRLLIGHLTVTDVDKLVGFLRPDKTDDEATAHYLSLIARAVSDSAPLDGDGFKSGNRLDASAFSTLTDDARDALAQACLDNWSIQIDPQGDTKGPLTGKRAVIRLRWMLEQSYTETEESRKRIADTFAKLVGASDAIRDKLGGLKYVTVERPQIDPLLFKLPPNPILKTNQHLADMRDELDKLVEITSAQAGMTQSLAETARDTLQQSIGYGEEAKRATGFAQWGVYVAGAALLISIALLVVDIVGHVGAAQEAEHSARTMDAFIAMQAKAIMQTADVQRTLRERNGDTSGLAARLDALILTETSLIAVLASERKPNRAK